MNELKLNKKFNTREEMEKFIEEMSKKYIVFMINHAPVTIGEPEKFEIESIFHFGER